MRIDFDQDMAMGTRFMASVDGRVNDKSPSSVKTTTDLAVATSSDTVANDIEDRDAALAKVSEYFTPTRNSI